MVCVCRELRFSVMSYGYWGCGGGVGVFFFFFNDTATTEIYTLSLHDALPIFRVWSLEFRVWSLGFGV